MILDCRSVSHRSPNLCADVCFFSVCFGDVVLDALAYGKSAEELAMENVPEDLRPHKTFPGTHQN
jgi:hypothetical protein